MYEQKQMALYFYSQSREYDTLNDLLMVNKNRFIHSDGYGVYHDDSYGIDVGCMAHVRRKIYEAATTSPLFSKYNKTKDKEEKRAILESSPSFANQIQLLGYIQKLFDIDEKVKKAKMDGRQTKNQK